MAAKKKAKPKTGAQRMKQLGHKPCQVWFDKTEREILQQAAALEYRPMATFVRRAAIELAKKVMRDFDLTAHQADRLDQVGGAS